MKKINTKKTTAIILAMALAGTSAFAGCGKKTVDYDVDGDAASVSADGGELAAKLGIPSSYEGDLEVGSSGLSEIEIDDNDIVVPSGDSMSVVYYNINTFDSDYKQQVCEAIFDKSSGIYVYDWESLTTDDINSQIATYQALLESAQADGDEDTEEYCEEYIEYLQEELENAVDERTAATDYEDDDYIGYIGDNQFLLCFMDSEDSLGAYFELSYYPTDDLLSYRPCDGATYAYAYDVTYSDEVDDLDGLTNACILSEEDAQSIALEFLSNCGIDDVVMTSSNDLAWEYYDTSYEIVNLELDGYIMTFSRSVNGAAPYTGDLSMIDTMEDADTWYDVAVETYEIQVDSNGVIAAVCNPLLTPTGDEDKNVDLLTWDALLEILNANIGNYFTEHSTSYSSIEFNDVRLTYYLMVDSEDSTLYKYVPVWVFAEADEYDGEYDYEYPIQAVVVDAVTGEFYDIETLLSIGDAWSYDDIYSSLLIEDEDDDDDDDYDYDDDDDTYYDDDDSDYDEDDYDDDDDDVIEIDAADLLDDLEIDFGE